MRTSHFPISTLKLVPNGSFRRFTNLCFGIDLGFCKCSLAVPQYDVIPLQLIPMLVGFFTYKGATFVETFKELLPKSEVDSEI